MSDEVIATLAYILNQGGDAVEQLRGSLRLLCKHRSQVIGNTLADAGTRVRSGPFAGLEILPPYHDPLGAIQEPAGVSEGCYVPKLLGCYEQDLHPVLAALPSHGYQAIVNIGCAEGYYAVGLARLCRLAVDAYDIDPAARRLCAELADRNRVTVRLGAVFTPEDFARYAGRRTFVLCDIEGGERELCDPERAPALRELDLLVEVHDEFVSGIARELERRFAPSHEVEAIRFGPRDPSAFTELAELDNLDQLLALWEWRLAGNHWLWLRARQPAGAT